MNNADFKNILITVAGSTPQILTETLYDLIIQRKLEIDRIIIITTKHGKKVFEQRLLDTKDGQFYKFCADYGIPAYKIQIEFVVIKNEKGEELLDIRSKDDNRLAANCIVKTIRDNTQDENIRIFASIAGGRKTMSTFMGYAMQLYGRKQDKLFHVLVAPETLESNPYFYFPPSNRQDVSFKDRQGQVITVPHNQIKISNAEIPFIRLREILPFIHGPVEMQYEDLVKLTQKEITEAFVPVIKLDFKNSAVIVKWREQVWNIKLKPIDFAFYCYMLKQRSIVNSKGNQHEKAIQELYLKVRPDVDKDDRTAIPSFNHEDLIDSRPRINRKIKEVVTFDKIHQFLIIHSHQKHRIPTYYITLPESNIKEKSN